MTTGPGTGRDVIAPGRQDRFLENRNPVFRSADIIVAPPRLSNVLAAALKQLRVLRFALSLDSILTPPYEAPCERSQGYKESISMTEYKYPPLPVTEAFLKEITDKIVQALKPEKIFLFGSYAYGKPGKDSDVDLLIIMESSERPAKRRIQVSRLFWDRPVPMDFLVKTPSEFAERMSMGDFFIKKILTKGKVLYDEKAR